MSIEQLRNELIALYQEQEKHLKNTYDRSLPFQDALFDRFERARSLGFAEDASIYNSSLVFGQVHAGKKTWVGPFVILDGSGGHIKIGDYCSISAGVHIYTHDSVKWTLSGGQSSFKKGAVTVGNNSYLGAQVIIKAGISIGSHCVIGANSFINQDVANNSIMVGSPAKKIGEVVIKNDEITMNYYGNETLHE